MEENVPSCCGMSACCHRHDPEKDIIEGTFEIDHSPWLSLCAAGESVARIYSIEKVDPRTGKGIESENAYLIQGKVVKREKHPIMKGKIDLPTRIIKFKLKFEVVREFGTPGAFVIENKDKHEFFLKSATLQYKIPASGKLHSIHFNCSSWVYPLHKTGVKRVFFFDKLYLPWSTPSGLVELRKKELEKLRRGGVKGERKPWDRIYEYDTYNDLGDPDNGREYARPVLGGSTDYPYPRRLRTGRPACQHDPLAESRPAGCFQTNVPPDERLSHEKQKELRNNFVDALVQFLALKSDHPPRSDQRHSDLIQKIVRFFVPEAAVLTGDFRMIQSIVDLFRRKTRSSSHQDTRSFNSLDDMLDIFSEKEVKEMEEWVKEKLKKLVPDDIFNEVVATATKRNLASPQLPSIIAEEKYAWVEPQEFGRQMLAGTNPVRIRLLNPKNQDFETRTEWNEPNVLTTINKAMELKRAFILEHDDYLLPFLNEINEKGVCAYATRTVLVRSTYDETLDPKAIELCLPGDNRNMVVFPNNWRWPFAQLHVAANDAAHHQLVSHWLHTHAVIEPFIIATRRQLSVMHPIHRLLDPHFKDTLHINALARGIFLNAGGILEQTLFTGQCSMRISSHFYKEWRFDEQALPRDLEKRGMAVKAEETVRDETVSGIKEKPAEKEPEKIDDEDLAERDNIDDEDLAERDENPVTEKTPDVKVTYPAGVKLILEDYPYAKDGTEIWDAIETWVRAYCEIFYANDYSVNDDLEIQSWWLEIREEGHGDQKEGWYDLTTRENLVRALTTLIWIASGLHAAVNFGQYAYAGWPPNRPMLLRKFVPEADTQEFEELNKDPEKFVLKMLPEKFEMEFAIAVMDLLSRQTSDEVYLGQRSPTNEWTEDKEVNEKLEEVNDQLKAVNEKFTAFGEKLKKIEKNIRDRNKQYILINRWGFAKIPYKLLYPDTSKTKPPSGKDRREKMDISGRGIPNSISI